MNRILPFKSVSNLFLVLTFILCPSFLMAQFQLNAGYNYGYVNPEKYNEIIQRFNSNSQLNIPIPDLNSMHGVQLGIRRYFDNLAIEFDWLYQFNKLEGIETNPVSGNENTQQLFNRVNRFSIGVENYFGFFGYGGTIDLNNYVVKKQFDGATSKDKVLNGTNFSSQFFISLTTNRLGSIALSLRPYILIPWTKINLKDLATNLNETPAAPDVMESFPTLGIKLIFING